MGFLTDKLLAYLGGAAALVLAIALGWQTLQVHRARGALAAVKAQVVAVQASYDQCKANRLSLQASLDRQNAAVTALEQASATRAAEIAKARQAARSEALRADHAIDLLSKAQPAGNDACARTLDAVRIARGAAQ
jgi:hypothetical protein